MKYKSSIDFYFINTKIQKEKAFQTKQTKANWIVPSTFRLSIQSRYFPITVISGVWKREISEFVLFKDLPKSTNCVKFAFLFCLRISRLSIK